MSEHIWDIRITDTSLRDGSHHKRHQFTREEVGAIVAALDGAGVPVIEVTHGDGLGGSSFNYGFSKTPEQELIKVAAETAKEIAMHVVALSPQAIRKEDLDPAVIDKEREILTEAARNEGKPDNIIAKMIEGRLRNFFAQCVLLEQPFVKDDKQSVGQLAKQAGIEIKAVDNWRLGE